MSWEIHCRRDANGEPTRFRVWSTVVDAYITDELDEDAARDFYLTGELEVVIRNAANLGWDDARRQLEADAVAIRFTAWWLEAVAIAKERGGCWLEAGERPTVGDASWLVEAP